jgi:hypothetical protein
VELLLSKCLDEDVYNRFGGWKTLQMDDPVMYHLYDVMHMDLNVFGPLSLHQASAKLESILIVTPNDSQMVELDSELNEEVLNPKNLNSDGDPSSVLDLC